MGDFDGGVRRTREVTVFTPDWESPTAQEVTSDQSAPQVEDGNSRLFLERFSALYVRYEIESRFDSNDTPVTAYTSTNTGASQPIDRRRVEEAVDKIKENLEQGFFNDVTHSDLREIEDTFRGLSPAEANAVFSRLTNDELQTWTDELNSIAPFGLGGYDRGEKQRLFNLLASKLDGNNLARFANALDEAGDGQLFGAAIAARASDRAKEQFIRAAAARAQNDPTTAVAVAEAIGGLRNNPAALQRALSGLTQSQINKIVEAATQKREYYHEAGVTVSYDAGPLGRMLNAVSAIRDPHIKARFFEPAAQQLREIEETNTGLGIAVLKGDSARQVRSGLTNILNSDTTGVVAELERNFRDGKGITSYLKSMLNSGQERQIGRMISRLLEGNDHSQNPITRFGTQVRGTDGKPHYDNAENVGYFLGGIHAAARQITGNRERQANIIKNIFGTIAGAVGAAGPETGVPAAIINGLTTAIVDDVVSRLNDRTISLRDALRELAFPRDPRTGQPYEGAAEGFYDSAVGRVIDANS